MTGKIREFHKNELASIIIRGLSDAYISRFGMSETQICSPENATPCHKLPRLCQPIV